MNESSTHQPGESKVEHDAALPTALLPVALECHGRGIEVRADILDDPRLGLGSARVALDALAASSARVDITSLPGATLNTC